MRVEFLLEEASMKYFLQGLLPRILPEHLKLNYNCFLPPHDGKSDLFRSIPNKIRVFSNATEECRVVILHDQDSNDCKILKAKLRQLVYENGNCTTLIRIPCRELENWYLGDLDALEKIYPRFMAAKFEGKAKFRIPDMVSGTDELKKKIPSFTKSFAAQQISPIIDIENNRSESFNQFVNGLRAFLA